MNNLIVDHLPRGKNLENQTRGVLGQSSEIAIAVDNNSLEEQKKPEEKDTLCVDLAKASIEPQAEKGILALKQTKEMLGVHGHVGGRGRGIIPERCAPHVPFQLGQSLELATQSIANEEPQQFAVINNSLEEENKQEENDTFCEDLARASVEPRAVDDIMALKAAVHHRGRGRGRGKIADCSTQRVLPLGQSLQLAISPVAIEQQLKAHWQLKRMNVSQQAAGSAALKERSPPREVASLKLKLAKSTTNGGAVATRALDSKKKQGTVGERIRLHSNYYRVLKRPDWTINQYHVDFEPDIDNTRMRRIYLNGLRDQIGAFIFDGQVLYCARHLSKNELQLETFDHNNEKILVKLRYTNIVEIMDGHQYQFLNLLLRRALEGLNLQLISRNYFDPQAKINIEKLRMELWPGYITSVHQHEKETLLCVEITHKVMRTETLLDIYGKCRKNQEDFKNEVKGTVVLTDYNNKTYRIDGVDFLSTPRSTFDTKDGDISYIDYYAKRYGIKIRVDEQPLLVSKVKDKRNNAQLSVMLIPELCRATGITDAMRANKRLMREMNEHTHMVPKRRIQWLQNFNKRLLSTAQSADLLKAWGIDLDTELIELPARILPSQTILLKNRSYTCDSKVDWTRELRHGMYSSVRMKNWCVINQQRRRREAQNFIDLCIDAAAEMGMTIAKPAYYEIGDDKEYTIGTNIKKAVMMDPQIIMFILEQAHEAKYSHFKKLTCVEHPVPSQVVTLSKIMPRKNFGSTATARTIAAKVVIQMNAKLGGVPWLIKIPIKGLMSIGFDVGHSPKNKDRSYGAFVASLETEKSSKFFSIVHELSKGQELCDKMRLSIIRALEAYKQHNGALPEKIVFYRDGVSEGQEDQVLRTELQNFKDGMMEIYKSAGLDKACPTSLIVVTKRINTRLMYRHSNPPAGTVVDEAITLPEGHDFFLVSQNVSQGTVSPTCFHVIYNKMGISPDQLQLLTYKMCHNYLNWSGTVRVPSVCQYAHKLAFLVSESIQRIPSPGVSKHLYFL